MCAQILIYDRGHKFNHEMVTDRGKNACIHGTTVDFYIQVNFNARVEQYSITLYTHILCIPFDKISNK